MKNCAKRTLRLLHAAVGVSACAISGTVSAQSTRATEPQNTQGIEDIVVTATRREERLQDVPVTVTALGSGLLEAADVSTVRTLNQVVPAFTGGRGGGAFFPVIRGVGSTGISVADEPNVALYIDGVYQPDATGNWIDLVEVERVEVLRGPQGTVFGRNATGGLVNVITPDPDFETRGRVAGRVGFMRNNAMEYDARGYITGGLSDTLAADLAINYVKTEGYIDDLVRGSDNLGSDEVINLRGKLLFEPSDTVRFVLTGSFMDRDGSPNVPQPYNGNTAARTVPGVIMPTGPWQGSLTQDTILDVRRYTGALQSRFEFGAVNLETTTGYNKLDNWYQLGDSDSTNIFLESFPAGMMTESWSQEVRLLSATQAGIQWIFGGYFFDLDGVAPFSLISNRPGTGLSERIFRSTLTTRSYAGFAEATHELLRDLFVTAGLRYTWEERTFNQNLNGRDLFGTVDSSFDKWTYRFALRYNFAEDANVYASYGTGYKSGVYNMSGTSPVPVRPETINAWEVGLKADPFDWLRTNLAAYYYDYKDLQVQAKDVAGPGYVLQNAATAEIYGFEFEAQAQLSSELDLRASVARTDATYDRFPGAQGFVPLPQGGNQVITLDASGNKLGRTPGWTANLGGDYSRQVGSGRIEVSTNLFYSSRVYYDFGNIFSQKPYALWNAQVAWVSSDDLWRFSLSGTNLTNEAVFQQIRPGAVGTDAFYEMPRRISIGIERLF